MFMCVSQFILVDKLSFYNISFLFLGYVISCVVYYVILVWLFLMIMNGKKIVIIYFLEIIFQILKSLKVS